MVCWKVKLGNHFSIFRNLVCGSLESCEIGGVRKFLFGSTFGEDILMFKGLFGRQNVFGKNEIYQINWNPEELEFEYTRSAVRLVEME